MKQMHEKYEIMNPWIKNFKVKFYKMSRRGRIIG